MDRPLRDSRGERDAPRAAAAADAGQMRLVGTVIAAAMLLWLGANWAGGHWNWPGHYAFLADLAAIGAMVWSLLVTWRIWHRRQADAAVPQKR